MEIKHVPGYSPMSLVFLEYDEWISAVCMTQFTKPGTHLEQHSMLNNFENYETARALATAHISLIMIPPIRIPTIRSPIPHLATQVTVVSK